MEGKGAVAVAANDQVGPEEGEKGQAWSSVRRPDGQEIAYMTLGDAASPVLVLIHSFLCHSTYMWGKLLDQEQGLPSRFRVIACDIRGHGKSAPMTAPVSDLYEMVDDCIAVLDQENVDKATFVGLSIGGMISMRAAIKYPKRVEKLVLLNTDAHKAALFDVVQHVVLGNFVLPCLGWGPVAPTVKKQFFAKATKEQAKGLRQMLDAQHTSSLMGILKPLDTRKDIIKDLEKVQQQALIMHGDKDKALDISLGRDIAKALQNSQFVPLAGAGHISTLEVPDKILTHVLKFLEMNEY